LTFRSQEEPTLDAPQLRTVVQEIINVPQERTIFQTGEEPDNTFAACLLIMDDNHVLIEWLAYHYDMLPLRRLIVAVDPASQTSPSKILDRYRDRALMNITEWGDDDFMPKNHTQVRELLNKSRKPQFSNPSVDLHRDRQSYFISQCLATLKEEGADWVIHIDTDEYILPNYVAEDPYRVDNSSFSNTTIYEIIQQKKHVDPHMGSSCIGLSRLRLGAKESNPSQVQKMAPTGFNASNFQTLRWRWHGHLDSVTSNGHCKAMVDVSRIPKDYLQPTLEHNPHRLVKKVCRFKKMYIHKRKATFIVHHYGGTWEQWSFRQDPRRGGMNQRTSDSYKKLQGYADGETDHIRPWLSDFIRKHGQELASALLEGVGEVPSSSPY
jgi:hypothetical protein